MSRVSFLARFAFWSAALVALVMALLPKPPDLPFDPSDKLQHAAAFMTLAVLAAIAYPKTSLVKIGTALVVFGAAIEFLQLIPALRRDAQLSDWIVDSVAIIAVLAIVGLLRPGRPGLT